MARAFAPSERFVSEVKARKLRPAYVFVGDEVFFRDRCRDALLEHLVPAGLREFSFYDLDLAATDIVDILDRARTPSLMAPFQVFFIRNVKTLYGRGSHKDAFAAIEAYVKDPNRAPARPGAAPGARPVGIPGRRTGPGPSLPGPARRGDGRRPDPQPAGVTAFSSC